MDLKDIAAVSGKSGLFKVVKPTRTGVILESLDEAKKKSIASGNSRVSVLKEISVYTTGDESSILLEDLFDKILAKHGKDLAIDHKADSSVLFKFLSEVLPDYDEERVYASDLKKMVLWYKTIAKSYPEIFEVKKTEEKPKKAKAADKKPAAKKTAAAKKPAVAKTASKKAVTKKTAVKK